MGIEEMDERAYEMADEARRADWPNVELAKAWAVLDAEKRGEIGNGAVAGVAVGLAYATVAIVDLQTQVARLKRERSKPFVVSGDCEVVGFVPPPHVTDTRRPLMGTRRRGA